MKSRLALLSLVLLVGNAGAIPTQVSDTFRSDVIRLLEVSGARNMAAQLSSNMTRARLSEGVPEDVHEIIRQVAHDTLWANYDRYVELVIPIYARHFSHQEVKQLIAFYESPLGAKTLKVMPAMMAELMQAGEVWANDLQPKFASELTQRLTDAGYLHAPAQPVPAAPAEATEGE